MNVDFNECTLYLQWCHRGAGASVNPQWGTCFGCIHHALFGKTPRHSNKGALTTAFEQKQKRDVGLELQAVQFGKVDTLVVHRVDA